jgi:hypothetical protein
MHPVHRDGLLVADDPDMMGMDDYDVRIAACRASAGPMEPHTCGFQDKMYFQGNEHTHDGAACVDWAHCTRLSDKNGDM